MVAFVGGALAVLASDIALQTLVQGARDRHPFDNRALARLVASVRRQARALLIEQGGKQLLAMGELGVAAVAPAIGNALFNLTGKRVRQVPLSPAAVKKVLAA